MIRSMGSSSSSRGIAAIVGVGPNLGRSIARKFAHHGYTVAILARDLGMHICTSPTQTLYYIITFYTYSIYMMMMLACIYMYREIVEIGGRDSEGRESASVCNEYRLLRLKKCEGCIRRSTLTRIRRGSCLRC